MQVKQIYNILHKKTQIHGNTRNSLEYQIIKKYEDPIATLKSKLIASGTYRHKPMELKRGHYLQDEYHMKKDIPGPGNYQLSSKLQPKQSKPKNKSSKKTYLDEAIFKSKKQKFPAPGQYDVLKQMGKDSLRPDNSQKRFKTERLDYLDNAQYQGTLTPGVGQYDINRYQKSMSQQKMPKLSKSPQFWRSKHQKSLNKLSQGPDIGRYNPKPIQYELFEQKSKVRQILSYDKNLQNRKKRIKTEEKGAKLGPGKYNIVHEWKGKQKKQKGILDNISKGISQRVYY